MIDGVCKPGFERVAEEFEENFAGRGEVGASVCLTSGGETVVDLWGGVADPSTNAAWTRDTVSLVHSATKGATALCAHILASRGQLDLDAPVMELWREFFHHGKRDVTTRMMLDQSAGVPALREKVKEDGPFDWAYMTDRVATEQPFWEPGTRSGYHGLTFGWLVGEVVRRVSGKSLGSFFRDEVAGPLKLDFWIGLPEEIELRVAPVRPFVYPVKGGRTTFVAQLMNDPQSISALFVFNAGAWRGGNVNSRAAHAAEIPAANGITNARGLAGLYAPLANGGGTLVDGRTLTGMAEVSTATHDDATLRIPTRFSPGFMKSMDNRRGRGAELFGPAVDSLIMGSAAFGHAGAGGSLGFADPAAGLSFGYTMNRLGPGLLMNERGQALVDAAYLSLGYTSKDGGVWVK